MNDTSETPKLSWWRRLSNGLKRTSSSLGTAVADLVTKRKLDRAMLDELGEAGVEARIFARHRRRAGGDRSTVDL